MKVQTIVTVLGDRTVITDDTAFMFAGQKALHNEDFAYMEQALATGAYLARRWTSGSSVNSDRSCAIMNKPTDAQIRLAAFEEFLKQYRSEHTAAYALLTKDLIAVHEESVRKVFYAGYASGKGVDAVARISGLGSAEK